MLRAPHTTYDRLFVYYFDRADLPQVNDPDIIGTWIEDDKAILFFHCQKDEMVRDICRLTGASIIYQAELDYKDWEAGTVIESFTSGSFYVRPVWQQADKAGEDSLQIVLDPSVIFGSGFHATTRLCLETLDLVMRRSGEKVSSILDLGTGTGLLAIAGAKLGVSYITAVDNNPLACEVARNNVELNNCGSQVEVIEADIQSMLPDLHRYDLVIANLYKGLLVSLFENSRFWEAGLYLLSGFMPGMEGDLLAALPANDIHVRHRAGRDNWRLWLLQRNSTDGGRSWKS